MWVPEEKEAHVRAGLHNTRFLCCPAFIGRGTALVPKSISVVAIKSDGFKPPENGIAEARAFTASRSKRQLIELVRVHSSDSASSRISVSTMLSRAARPALRLGGAAVQ